MRHGCDSEPALDLEAYDVDTSARRGDAEARWSGGCVGGATRSRRTHVCLATTMHDRSRAGSLEGDVAVAWSLTPMSRGQMTEAVRRAEPRHPRALLFRRRDSRRAGMRTRAVIVTLLAAAWLPCASLDAEEPNMSAATVDRFAALALACVHAEYPNKLSHVLNSDADVAPPRELTPAFFGCFDWHSSVHGHWLLARLARLHPEAGFAAAARAALAASLSAERLQAEAAYLAGEGRESFERPYGLAWLLCLAEELRGWEDEQAQAWAANLAPLERAAAARLKAWLPKLHYPIRAGEHSQTAFAFGLILDWAEAAGDDEMLTLVKGRSLAFHLADEACPLAYEPSGQDFLSPCLAEADLMRRILPPRQFAPWLAAFLPGIPAAGGAGWLPVAVVTDRADGKLAHLDGLNLSRAWMLEGILAGLPADDPRRAALQAAAAAHRAAGLAAVTGEHYAGGHWLGSFATYLVTTKGIEGTLDR